MTMTVVDSVPGLGAFVAADTRFTYRKSGTFHDVVGKVIPVGCGWATAGGFGKPVRVALAAIQDAADVEPIGTPQRLEEIVNTQVVACGLENDPFSVSLIEPPGDRVLVLRNDSADEGHYASFWPSSLSAEEGQERRDSLFQALCSFDGDLATRIWLTAGYVVRMNQLSKLVSRVMECGYIFPTPDGFVRGFLRGDALEIAKTQPPEILQRFQAEPAPRFADWIPETVADSVPNGASYAKPLGSRINAGRPVIDFSEGIHIAKNVDNIADGSTYGRPLLSRLNAGKPVIDFSEAIHSNKTIDNVTDGATRKAVTAIDGAGKALIDLSQAHTNKNLDNVGDGSTYKRIVSVVGGQITPASSSTRRRCRLYHSVDQGTTNSTTKILDWDSESWDVGSLHSTSSNPSQIIVPSGMDVEAIELEAWVEWAANATGYRQMSIIKNGTLFSPPSRVAGFAGAFGPTQSLTIKDNAPTAGDYYQVQVIQTSGGALNVICSGSSGSNFNVIHLW